MDGAPTSLTDKSSSVLVSNVADHADYSNDSPVDLTFSHSSGQPECSTTASVLDPSEYCSGDESCDTESSVNSDIPYSSGSESDSEYEMSDSSVPGTTNVNSESSLSPQQLQAVTMLAYLLRHNATGSASKDLVAMMKSLFPGSTEVQHLTVNSIWKFVSDTQHKVVHYCVICKEEFVDDTDDFLCGTPNCTGLRYQGTLHDQLIKNRKPRGSFIVGDCSSQLRYVLGAKNWEHIQKRKREMKTGKSVNIGDVTDGDYYQDFMKEGQFLSDPNSVSAVFNTDGIPLYASSGVKLWPIFAAINELDPSVRFARENIILLGIWQGKGNPPFNAYLERFSEQMSKLYHDGITIEVEQKPVTVKLGVFLGTLDLQAKGYVLNMTMHNGTGGCSTCFEPGYSGKQGKGTAWCYPYRPVGTRFPTRTHESVIGDGMNATPNKRINGIKGSNGLARLPEFNLVTGMVPDYMHGVLMGVTKSLMQYWFSSKHSKKNYHIGKKLKEISTRMLSIKPPYYVNRLPRDLESSYAHFKATELQAWLLYYGPPCLKGILPNNYLEHFCLLSGAIHILLQDNISPNDLSKARQMLDRFYQEYSGHYGDGACGLNVHNIGAHLVDFVQGWGPIWAWSCFGFEDANASILNAVHGSGDVTLQILRMKDSQAQLRTIMDAGKIPDGPCLDFVKSQLDTSKVRSWKGLKPADECFTAGVPIKWVPENLYLLAKSQAKHTIGEFYKFLRLLKGSHKYYSMEYTRMKKKICHVLLLSDDCDQKIGSAKYFLLHSITKKVYVVVNYYSTVDANPLFSAAHLWEVQPTDQLDLVPMESVEEPLFFISTGSVMYVARIPNGYLTAVCK